jgi:hypothetical protein
MGDWIRLWDRAVLIEFNLDHVRVVRPQEDGSVLLMLGGSQKMSMRGFASIAALRAAGGQAVAVDELPEATMGESGQIISRKGWT